MTDTPLPRYQTDTREQLEARFLAAAYTLAQIIAAADPNCGCWTCELALAFAKDPNVVPVETRVDAQQTPPLADPLVGDHAYVAALNMVRRDPGLQYTPQTYPHPPHGHGVVVPDQARTVITRLIRHGYHLIRPLPDHQRTLHAGVTRHIRPLIYDDRLIEARGSLHDGPPDPDRAEAFDRHLDQHLAVELIRALRGKPVNTLPPR